MNKKSLGAMVLLVLLCLFTGHLMLAILVMLFEGLSQRYLYPVVKELIAGNCQFEIEKILEKDDEVLFGLVVSILVYVMILYSIIQWLFMNFGFWSLLMTIIYIIMPILGIIKRIR